MSTFSFRTRRILASAITFVVFALVVLAAWVEDGRLGHASVLTGSTLLATIILLALLGVRRRLPVLPLGSASTWTQVHLYMGFFAAGVYLIHVPAVVADGWFEGGLSWIFLAVTCSGFYGIYASRRMPKLLTAVEGQHRFDRVGWHRGQIAETARSLLNDVNEQSAQAVLGKFYENYLSPFFQTRPTMAWHSVVAAGKGATIGGCYRFQTPFAYRPTRMQYDLSQRQLVSKMRDDH